LDFTFVCPTEICQFSDANEEFEKLNCQVIGCSIDSAFVHREWTKKPRNIGGLGKMAFPMM
jgi:alkyl hydroperoxide reductase subunit AhpC